jgi:hypothetical protein
MSDDDYPDERDPVDDRSAREYAAYDAGAEATALRYHAAAQRIRDAIDNVGLSALGRSPREHLELVGRHRREWPELWSGIDALLATDTRDQGLR